MNERIQELIRLSAVPADQAENYAEYKGLVEPSEKLDVAKFAELIVRECGEVAWRNTPETEELEYSHLIKDKILEHFGVEE